MDYILSPSILSADFANLGADVKEAVKAYRDTILDEEKNQEDILMILRKQELI